MNKIKNYLVPTVIEKTSQGERAYDLYSRLLEDRIIFLSGEIGDAMANTIIAELLFLEGQDPSKDISIYINSPGGSVTAGLAILDTMNYIKCDVSTICVGMAASMASFILAGGTKGKRFSLPNSEVLIHQPLGGASGQASDVAIHAQHLLNTKKKMNKMMAEFTGQTVAQIEKDTDRDNIMSAEEAKSYGIIDKIFKNR